VRAGGGPAGLGRARRLAGCEATIVEMSWYGTEMVPLALGAAFHARRLILKSSQVGAIGPLQQPRWDARRRMQLTLQLLEDPVLDALITDESDFDALPAIMAHLAAAPGNTICHRIR